MSPRQQLDLSHLEPPDPLQRALEAIEALSPGDYLRLLFPREPVPLFMLLDQSGIAYQSRPGPGTAWEVLAWRNGDREAEQAMLADTELHSSSST